MHRHKAKYFYSKEEIDFSLIDLDYEKFLIQEFFTLDNSTLQEAFVSYQNRHGKLSLKYLQRTFSDWKNGNYHLTPLMRERITSLVSDFLSPQAKKNLCLHQFVSTIKKVVRDYHPFSNQRKSYGGHSDTTIKTWKELVEQFDQEMERINKIKKPFIEYHLLPEKHKEEAVAIGKSILGRKTKEKFDQIKRDLLIFHPYIHKFNKQSHFLYKVNNTKFSLRISEERFFDAFGGDLKISIAGYTKEYKTIVDKFLAQELIIAEKDRKLERQVNDVSQNDLEILWQHYNSLLEGTNYADITSDFQGAGGKLEITIQVKPKKLLKYTIADKLMKILILALAIFSLVKFIFEIENINIFIMVALVGIATFGFLLGQIADLKAGITEFKKYGK